MTRYLTDRCEKKMLLIKRIAVFTTGRYKLITRE